MAEDGVEGGGGALEEVEEGAGGEVGLLEVEVQADVVDVGGGDVGVEDLGLEALGDVVVEFELGVEGVAGGPALGDGEAWKGVREECEFR